MPLVSICIPVYNSDFFHEALGSALSQSMRDLEILVCDDSTDDRAEITTRAVNDPRIRYVRNPERLGFQGNFAQCHRLARGEFIKFLNHDDVLHPRCVELMLSAFRPGNNIRLAFTKRSRIDATGIILKDLQETAPLAEQSCFMEGFSLGNHCLIEGNNFIGEPSAIMYRREDVDLKDGKLFRIGERDYHCLADLSLWLRLLAKGDAAYILESLCGFRVHKQQLQRQAPIRTLCCVEYLHLLQEARPLGFLNNPAQYDRALKIATHYVALAHTRTDLSDEEKCICAEADQALARLPKMPPLDQPPAREPERVAAN